MTRRLYLAFLLLPASCGKPALEDMTPEQITVEFVRTMKEATALFAQATDRQSAERVRPKLEANKERMSRLIARDKELKESGGEAVKAAFSKAATKHIVEAMEALGEYTKQKDRVLDDPTLAPILGDLLR